MSIFKNSIKMLSRAWTNVAVRLFFLAGKKKNPKQKQHEIWKRWPQPGKSHWIDGHRLKHFLSTINIDGHGCRFQESIGVSSLVPKAPALPKASRGFYRLQHHCKWFT